MKIPDKLERYAIQAVVMSMHSARIIDDPVMAFLRNADGLAGAYFQLLSSDAGLRNSLASDRERYLLVLAYHAFGAGAYVAMRNAEGDDVEDMQGASAQRILADMIERGSLELGLKAISVPPESRNKQVLDSVVLSSLNEVYKKFKRELRKTDRAEYVAVLMQVYFNAGVTVAMRRLQGPSSPH